MKTSTKKLTAHLILSLLLSFSSFDASSWKLSTESENVVIYKSSSKTLKYDIFRVDANMDENLDRINHIIYQDKLLDQWFPMCKETRVISKSKNKIKLYMIFDFPFPLKDREAYIEVTRTINNQLLSFNLETIDEPTEANKNFIRIQKIQSSTIFISSETGLEVEQFIYLDPGGTIPRLFLNEGLPRELVKSFKKLKDLVS